MLHRVKVLHHKAAPEAIENEVICMRLVRSVIDDFSNVPEEHPKYTFPFLHYLTNATIIALGLIIKQPSFKCAYGGLTLETARSLRDHCRKTWVSEKMAQTVWKLNQMADATLSPSHQSPQKTDISAGPLPASPTLLRPPQAHTATVPNCPPSARPPFINLSGLSDDQADVNMDVAGFQADGLLSGETIDDGMEWLQTLFMSGLDARIPPVWD